jgi:hypothetical protein
VRLITHLHLVPMSRMRGAIPALLCYALMASCSVKKSTGTNLPLPLPFTFEALTAMKIHVEVFWVVTQYSVVVGYQRFRGPWCSTTILQGVTTQKTSTCIVFIMTQLKYFYARH